MDENGGTTKAKNSNKHDRNKHQSIENSQMMGKKRVFHNFSLIHLSDV